MGNWIRHFGRQLVGFKFTNVMYFNELYLFTLVLYY
jgi:hypothetical protein